MLREAGVVSAEVDGTRKYHTLRRDDLDARFPGLLDSVLRRLSSASETHSRAALDRRRQRLGPGLMPGPERR